MGILDKVNREDRENARLNRDSEVNPPEYDPGMGEDSWDNDDSWGSSDGDSWGSSDDSWGTDSGNSWDSGSNNNDSWGSTQNADTESDEDKIFKALGGVWKGVKEFVGEFVKSFKTFDVEKRIKFSKTMMILSAVLIAVSILLMILKQSWGFSILIGSMINISWGVVFFMFSYDKLSKEGYSESTEVISVDDSDDLFDDSDAWDNESNAFDDEEDEFNSYDTEGTEYDYDYDEDEEDEDLDFDYNDIEDDESEIVSTVSEPTVSKEEILDRISCNNGMVTRQYLYDCNIGVLKSTDKDFKKVREIKEGSEEFDAWEAVIQKSAELFRTNQEDMPYLIEAKEKLFYVMLEVKRVKWIKNLQQLVDEIVNIYRYDKESGTIDKTIYGIGDAVGDTWIIRIMKGSTATISLKDVYDSSSNIALNTENYMPIILGVDSEGSVVWSDFKEINALLVTGMPRWGKSWLVKSILYQMTMYLSPRDLNMVFMDPKGDISDFKEIRLPHVKKFVDKEANILKELRQIVKVEGPRRKKLIGDVGAKNIWDFKKSNPDVELPLLYIVIDEVVTLSDSMDKETKTEFQGLLRELVSQLPALGIRIFLVPHVIKDQIISKTTTDLILCRISVGGDEKHIETVCGVKNFPHKLTHIGDTAIRLGNDDTKFMHSIVLDDTNEGIDELFAFQAKLWCKLMPGCEKGSRYEEFKEKESLKNIEKEDKIEFLNSVEDANDLWGEDEMQDETQGEEMEFEQEISSDSDDEFDIW